MSVVQGRVDTVVPESPQGDVPGSMSGGGGSGGTVTLSNGSVVEYDWLVVALGAETTTFGIPGARQLAVPFCTYADALQVTCVWRHPVSTIVSCHTIALP